MIPTEHDLKVYEKAARRYCELAGLDPDETIMHGTFDDIAGVVHSSGLYTRRWKLMVRPLMLQHLMNTALKKLD